MNGFLWFRSWHGAATDHKWAVVASRSGVRTGVVSAIAWALLDYASQQADRGSIQGFDPEEYAVYSGFSQEEITAVIQAMNDKGILAEGRFVHWEKRQPKREDDSTDRVRKHRDMKRSVTQRNAPDVKEKDKERERKREEKEEEEEVDTEGNETKRSVTQCNAITEEKEAATAAVFSVSPDIQAERIYQKVAQAITFPARSREDDIGAIRSIMAVKQFNTDQAVAYLTPYFSEWKRRGYSVNNTSWLTDWAVSGQIPKTRENGAGKPRLLRGANGEVVEDR